MAGAADALGLLLRICEAEPPEVLRQWITLGGLEAQFDLLTRIGALRHVDNASIVRCYACDETHETAVDMLPGGRFRAFCPDAGYHDIAACDLTIHALSFEALGGLIQRGLGMRFREAPDELVEGCLWHFGERRFGRAVASVCFARRLGRADVLTAVRQILQSQPTASPALILTSAADGLPPGVLPARHLVLPPIRYAGLEGVKLCFDERGLEAALTHRDNSLPQSAGPFSPDFLRGVIGSDQYTFGRRQAEAIRIMYDAHVKGLGPLDQRYILAEAGSDQKRLNQLFSRHPAWGKLIKGDRKGAYWLDL